MVALFQLGFANASVDFNGNNLLRESIFHDNLVDLRIEMVENKNSLWNHAERVYWHLALSKNIMLDYDN